MSLASEIANKYMANLKARYSKDETDTKIIEDSKDVSPHGGLKRSIMTILYDSPDKIKPIYSLQVFYDNNNNFESADGKFLDKKASPETKQKIKKYVSEHFTQAYKYMTNDNG